MTDSLYASLPMYDLPEIRAANEGLWAAIAAQLWQAGVSAPTALCRPQALGRHWSDPALLLSQTCGYPLLRLPPHVQVVATPRYRAEGCEGAAYRSALIVRVDDPAATLGDLRDRRCAINGTDSNSGMNLLRAAVAPWARGGRFFGRVEVSGSHLENLARVGDGRADIAAIDCVTLALARQYQPGLVAGLRVLGWTQATAGLPLISAAGAEVVGLLREILMRIATDPAQRAVRDALLIDGFEVLPAGAYEAVGRLEREAIAAGYPQLV